MTERNQQEQNAAQCQVELLSAALTRAKENDGLFLNQLGKKTSTIYPKLQPVSHFNALMLALHSDEKGYSTNLYTMYADAKKRGDSVKTGEKGVPYIWYYWKDFVAKDDPEKRISREDFKALPAEEQSKYKPVRTKEIRTLFNIEQTNLPESDKESFEKAVKSYGPNGGRDDTPQDDKKLRMEVNEALQRMKDNLVKSGKDGSGVAHYDAKKDTVFIPAQKDYQDYPSYVQDVIRQMVTATGQPQRLGRKGSEQRERLIVELTSSIKMMQFGLPARISNESLAYVDSWKESIEANPRLLDAIEVDVNNALGMIDKAERGEKIELKEAVNTETQQVLNAKVQMLQDDNKRWLLYIKPESEIAFAVYPDKEDVGHFFAAAKRKDGNVDTARQELAQKYYNRALQHPEIKENIFGKAPEGVDLQKISKVSIFKSKEGKILCHVDIEGVDNIKSREVTPSQWQKMWLAENKEEYKRNLAAILFQDVLYQENKDRKQELAKEQAEEKLKNSPEQKAKEEKEEKAKEELTKAETKVVASLVLSPLLPKFKGIKEKNPNALILFRNGDYFETIQDDARKASNILGITLSKSNHFGDENGKPLETAAFPEHTLDINLPKLIRAGERVAICDLTENHQRQVQTQESNAVEENKEVASHGYHR